MRQGVHGVSRQQQGLSLIELLVFIIVVGLALAGVLMVFRQSVMGSADPLVRKQALAIAESILSEIEQQPFTYCDPDWGGVYAVAPFACAGFFGVPSLDQDNLDDMGVAQPLGPVPSDEGRLDTLKPFDNVADYAGYAQSNVTDITGNNSMNGYNVSVAIQRFGNTFSGPVTVLDNAALRIVVTVTAGREQVSLEGYRFRYHPYD